MKRLLKHPASAAAVFTAGIFVATIGFLAGSRLVEKTIPEKPWFEAHVSVPDFRVGENPQVTYSRVIRRNLAVLWSVEMQRRKGGSWEKICGGSGFAGYETDESKEWKMSLSRYMGDDITKCDIKPGEYRLVTLREASLQQDVSVVKRFRHVSEIFRVRR